MDPVFGAVAINALFLDGAKLVMGPTILVNICTLMAITKKIHSHQELGGTGFPISSKCTMVYVICVESSVLMIIITCIFFISSTEGNNPDSVLIPMQLLVHVYVSLHVSCRISIQANETDKHT